MLIKHSQGKHSKTAARQVVGVLVVVVTMVLVAVVRTGETAIHPLTPAMASPASAAAQDLNVDQD